MCLYVVGLCVLCCVVVFSFCLFLCFLTPGSRVYLPCTSDTHAQKHTGGPQNTRSKTCNTHAQQHNHINNGKKWPQALSLVGLTSIKMLKNRLLAPHEGGPEEVPMGGRAREFSRDRCPTPPYEKTGTNHSNLLQVGHISCVRVLRPKLGA